MFSQTVTTGSATPAEEENGEEEAGGGEEEAGVTGTGGEPVEEEETAGFAEEAGSTPAPVIQVSGDPDDLRQLLGPKAVPAEEPLAARVDIGTVGNGWCCIPVF
jgi:hypothetical protein